MQVAQILAYNIMSIYYCVLYTHHADGFHGEEHCAEEQRYAFDGAHRFAVYERRSFPENVVENQRKTNDGHASGDGGERRQEF